MGKIFEKWAKNFQKMCKIYKKLKIENWKQNCFLHCLIKNFKKLDINENGKKDLLENF